MGRKFSILYLQELRNRGSYPPVVKIMGSVSSNMVNYFEIFRICHGQNQNSTFKKDLKSATFCVIGILE